MFCWSWCTAPGEPYPEVFPTAKPLHIAATQGHSYPALILLDYGAFIDCADGKCMTPLHHAVYNNQTAMVKLLLDSGANPDAMDSGLQSPYSIAAAHGNIESVQLLIKYGADVQSWNRHGQTALHLAVKSGKRDVLAFLINSTIENSLVIKDIYGQSILYEAVCRGSDIPMAFLLSLAPPDEAYKPGIYSIMNAAIRFRSTTEVKMLLRRTPTNLLPVILNHRLSYGGTPLHTAVVLGKLDVMDLLLSAGAQLEIEGSEYGTALMGACATGRLAAVKLLVARGARTSYVEDGQCFSALTAAKNYPEVRRWLLVGRFLEGPKLLTYKVEGWKD